MDRKSFLKAGHTPTLLAAFLYFDLAFMVWVLLGPLGVQIAKDLALDHTQKGLMVATPVLAGALLGVLRIGGQGIERGQGAGDKRGAGKQHCGTHKGNSPIQNRLPRRAAVGDFAGAMDALI